ncbi:amidase [Candidatus Rariloculus sp.]|uniref:amidase n=1 Tax=Candidatus Rariloculus sp. TaxID=3101265 RepID=UPI003D1268F1
MTETTPTRRDFVAGSLAAGALLASDRAKAQPADLTELTIGDAANLIQSAAISPTELVTAYLDRIERLDPRINSYITVTAELALEQARALEAELAGGRWRGPLHGIPIALKDNMDTADIATTAASELFADRVPDEDAEVYRRLKDAGAILLGKLNLHEFAYGGTSTITHFGPVHNPWSLDHIPGGSSGGSAAAVAARLCPGALGTDTLASIRQPAAFCGVVGLKATHGLASIRGIVPISETLDHVGPLCRSVEDAALMLQAIAGYDPRDPVSIRAELPSYASALNTQTGTLRIGLPRDPYYLRLDPEIERAMATALEVLGGLSAGFRDVTLPATPDFGVILAEAYAYHDEYLDVPANHARYDPATIERIIAAGGFSAAEYIDARRELALARNAVAAVFTDVDLLVTPTTPTLPSRIEAAEGATTPTGAESTVRNTAPFNVYGIPTINVPCGFSSSGLPIGLQISGPRLGEPEVLALAHAYEQATAWHEQRPPLD